MDTPTATLLKRHRPLLKYDSQESYFADAATIWTDNPGNVLRTAGGKVIATAGHGLSLHTLVAKYADGTKATATDVISDPRGDYRPQARALHQQSQYANQLYGHAVRDSAGDLWLQYWFFYFYNDFNLIGDVIKAGLHEGDWEMIQIHLHGETPDRAIFAQHKGGERRDWRKVKLAAGTQRPIVYVARGSHASYFDAGTHWTGSWFDQADGKRKTPELALNVVDDSKPEWQWLRWPGSWGDTKSDGSLISSDSPRGPGHHDQWHDPLALEPKDDSADTGERPVPPPAPRIQAGWSGDELQVSYALDDAGTSPPPAALVVTINSPDEIAPPTATTFAVSERTGTVTISADADSAHRYDIHASAATADGIASESARADLGPAA